MKRSILAGVAALALFATGTTSFAQAVSIDLTPEYRTRIKEYVVKERVRPYAAKERITVGTTLPADVELRAVPSDWGPSVSRYHYVYSDDRVHFVDPASRRVISRVSTDSTISTRWFDEKARRDPGGRAGLSLLAVSLPNGLTAICFILGRFEAKNFIFSVRYMVNAAHLR